MRNQQALEDLEEFVRGHFDDLLVSMSISSTGCLFLNIWQQPSELNNGYVMKYNPVFHVIATVDERSNLSLKLVTFHGKILIETCDGDTQLTNEEKLNFVKRLQQSHLCKGFELVENEVRLDPKTFSNNYLVEQFEENVIIRSRQCDFTVSEGKSVCNPCLILSNKQPIDIKPKTTENSKEGDFLSEATNILNGSVGVDEDEDNVLHILRNYDHFIQEGEDTKPPLLNKTDVDKAKQASTEDDELKGNKHEEYEDNEESESAVFDDDALNNHVVEEEEEECEDEDFDEADLQWLLQADPVTIDMSKLSEEEISRKRKAYHILKRKAKKLKLEVEPDGEETCKKVNNVSIIPFSKRRPQINYGKGDIKPFR